MTDAEILADAKPCPFCAKASQEFDETKYGGDFLVHVQCGSCFARGPVAIADRETALGMAVDSWNGAPRKRKR